MSKELKLSYDWHRTKEQGVKQRGSLALVSAFVQNNTLVSTTNKRYVWPIDYNNGSRYMTRKIAGRDF